MDALKILGELLGSGGLHRGGGRNVLEKILGADAPRMGACPSNPQPIRSSRRPQASPQFQGFPAPQGRMGHVFREAQRRSPHAPRRAPARHPAADPRQCNFRDDQLNDYAALMIRAMISAAKSDGFVDAQEQEQIVRQLGQLSPNEIQFLRNEFAKPINMQEIVLSVPPGYEDDVYAASLMGMRLDENCEAQYLHQLAQALGLSPQQCNQIHAHFGVPPIFRC